MMSERTRQPISKRQRFEIFKRDSFRCVYCGKGSSETKLQLDHVRPFSRGGSCNDDNLVTSCVDCNLGKSNVPIEGNGGAKMSRSTTLYCFQQQEDGSVGYVGEVISETETKARVEAVDGIMFFFGLWQPSGRVYDVAKSELRLFNDIEACAREAHRVAELHSPSPSRR